MTKMTDTYPRVTLIGGDSYLGMNKVLEIKAKRFPSGPSSTQWVSFEIPARRYHKTFMKDGMNALDAEISYPEWEGGHKVIFLRGLINNKIFRDSLTKFVQMVPPGNSLIIFEI